MNDRSQIETGRIINDRYEVESRLGAGGFSEVVAATDRLGDRPVALKILRADALATDPRAAARLRQEAQILQAISHPNIVRVFDVDTFDDGQFLVMERIDGQGLDALLSEGSTIDSDRLLAMVRQILGALQAAHSRQVLHRDLKPENILITEVDGVETVKLVDFGIAKAEAILNADDPDEGITLVKTRAGNFVGTPRYSAPEMIVGDPSTAASDLFCLGLVVYEALMGQPLIRGTSHNEVINQLVFPRPFDLSDLPPPWDRWLPKMVEKSPDHRFQSVQQAAQLLDELFQGSTDLDLDLPGPHQRTPEVDEDALYPSFDDGDELEPTVNEDNLKTAQWEPLNIDEVALEENRRRAQLDKGRDFDKEGLAALAEAESAPDPSPRELVETSTKSEDTDSLLLFVVFALLAFVIAGFLFLWLAG